MNLRKMEESPRGYTVGLDIGTGSVGWAAVDEDGELLKFKGRNTWGSRLFDTAQTAADTRAKRTLRRRYNRRLTRIMDLRALIYPDVAAVDPDFFNRLGESSLHLEDRSFNDKHAIFVSDELTESWYYEQYPTIYHLRERLVADSSKADIRLVYLALHHMMKYRGNFLIEGDGVSAKNADATAAVSVFLDELASYCDRNELAFDRVDIDAGKLNELVSISRDRRAVRQEGFTSALRLPSELKKASVAFGKAVFGYQAAFGDIFEVDEGVAAKFSLANEDAVSAFEEALVDEDQPLFQALIGLHGAFQLSGILLGAPGKTISSAMVESYRQHKEDLQHLKALVRKYFPEDENGSNAVYNETFKGPRYADGTYKKGAAKGYTAYILNYGGSGVNKKPPAEVFYKYLKDLFSNVQLDDEDAAYWADALKRMEDGSYLRKQRTSDNGSIPHQFHLEEMHAILENQKAYYPTLAENQEKIESLLKFRLPYYVGPLGTFKNPKRKRPFGWAIRREDAPAESIKPWNIEQIIDRDATAEAFIENLTGTCSYLLGKPVIPKYSLLYSEFCVRQELNVCKVAFDGENFKRLDPETAENVFNAVFKSKKRVRTSDVSDYLRKECGYINSRIEGTQQEGAFASSLGSYCDFKRILGREIESYEDIDMVENLIRWVTVFEDKKILARKVRNEYGPEGSGVLDEKQVKAVCKLRYTGWSRLSAEFLTGLKAEFEGARVSIMGVLRNSRKNACMNLMEILADERFGFQKLLEERNAEFIKDGTDWSLEEIPGSPAIKRGINQSLKIVQEITEIAGKAPSKICVEVAREEVGRGKGSRTRSRYQDLQTYIAALTDEARSLSSELSMYKDQLDDRRVFLYFLQGGKCLYSGEKLDINQLRLYDVDHIVPQSMVKDDSIDNTALVLPTCNRTEKRDEYPLPESIRKRNAARWKHLANVGLISKKKYANLTCAQLSERQVRGFINRQLVETRQISKHVVSLLQSIYPDATIEMVKAELASNFRNQYGCFKSRTINDYHHAHDAYLACQLSRFLSIRFPNMAKDLNSVAFTGYSTVVKGAKTGKSGLIVNSFAHSGFDKETGEIFRDSWDADFEIGRIKKCLNYKDCFVSRKTEILTGAFWDQTVYSSREPSDNAIPLKIDKDPKKYGYYKSPASAYYALIEHTGVVRGKTRRTIEVVGIPINAANNIDCPNDLQKYLDSQYESPIVLRDRIPKYQLIEWDGCRYYMTSQSEMINARQLWLPSRFVEAVSLAEHNRIVKELGSEEATAVGLELYGYMCECIKAYPRYKKPAEKLAAEGSWAAVQKMGAEDLWKFLIKLIQALHADAMRGAEPVLSASFGRMNCLNFGASMQNLSFIDTSVTGMYESKWTIGL